MVCPPLVVTAANLESGKLTWPKMEEAISPGLTDDAGNEGGRPRYVTHLVLLARSPPEILEIQQDLSL